MPPNCRDPGKDYALSPRDEAFSDFARRPPWYEDIHPELDPRRIVEDIANCLTRLHKFKESEIEEKEKFLTGYTEYHQTEYVIESLRMEHAWPPAVIDHLIHCLKADEYDTELKKTHVPEYVRLRFTNMMKVLNYLFPSALFPQRDINDIFTLKGVQYIHSKLARQLIPNGGDFRTKCAAPNGEFVLYMMPELIVKELDHLFATVREEARVDTSKVGDAIPVVKLVNLASSFLSRFLFIHPFSNGNGRVARLLMSVILSPISVVPVQLYFRRSRESFFQALRDAQTPMKPSLKNLKTGILESVYIALTNACFALDL